MISLPSSPMTLYLKDIFAEKDASFASLQWGQLSKMFGVTCYDGTVRHRKAITANVFNFL